MIAVTRDRIGATLGSAYVVLIFVGNTMNTAGSDLSGHASGAEVLESTVREHGSAVATTGFVLEVLGFVAFVGFLGWISDLLRRLGTADRSRAAGFTAAIAGVTMLAIKLASAMPSAVLEIDRHAAVPQVAQLLNDLNNAAFVISWLPFAMFVGALAVALRATAAVGRPTAFIGVFLGIAGAVVAIVGMRDIDNAVAVPFLLGELWLLVVSVRLAVQPARTPTKATRHESRVDVPA